MKNSNFLQREELFTLNTLKCLRNEYLFNDCNLCFFMCESEAIGVFKEKIHLFEDKCINCADCIGICPTEALTLENFDVIDFVINFKKDTIVEKVDIPSLSMFDFYHLCSLVLRAKKSITLKYEELSEIKSNYLKNVINQTNLFLKSIDFEHKILLDEKKEQIKLNRRGFFKNIFDSKKELEKEKKSSDILSQNRKNLPAKITLFKNSLKLLERDFSSLNLNFENFSNKTISKDACTNCGDCITFCPTQALVYSDKKDSILFESGRCISCSICKEACKDKAINEEENIDLSDYIYDKRVLAVEFDYQNCRECKTPFIYKGGKKVCERCRDFTDNFPDMFTLAKDI